MRSKAVVAERDEMQTKIRMVLEAHGQPMKVSEIKEHPTMTDISGHRIAQTMRHMTGVSFGKGKRWRVIGKKTKVTKPKRGSKLGVSRGPYKNPKEKLPDVLKEWAPNARFKITKAGQLWFCVNEVCFPVEVE